MVKEVKIGILVIVAFAISFWGYKFILGKNILVQSNSYNVLYEDVLGLQIGTHVRVSGIQKGVVAEIELLPDDKEHVLVVLDMEKGILIPKDTRAIIIVTSMMGAKAIILEYEKPCRDGNCAEPGSYLAGESRNLLASMASPDVVREYTDILTKQMKALADTLNSILLSNNGKSLLGKIMLDLQQTMANLNSGTARLDYALSSSGSISKTLTNVEILTKELADNKGKINNIIANADKLTQQLANGDIESTLKEVNGAIANLKATLKSADGSLAGISTLMEKVNKGEGTLGKLLKDEALYNNLNQMSKRIDSLVNDFQQKPYRYMPLKSRRKVQKYDRQDGN